MTDEGGETVIINAEQQLPKREDIFQQLEGFIANDNFKDYEILRDYFIRQRLIDILRNDVRPRSITIFSPPYDGFIHPDSEIKPTMFLDGFNLNDNTIYTLILDNIRLYKKDPRWADKNIRHIVPYAVLKTVGDYFGNYLGYRELETQHHAFYMDNSSSDSEAIPLSELRGKNIAMCTEKAALVQNLLAFLGYQTQLCLSQACQIGEKAEPHAFNIITTDRGRFIFDPTNPIIVTDTDGNLINILPASYVLTEEQYLNLIKGNTIIVEHTDFHLIQGQYQPSEKHIRKYGGINKE